jgi:hypothetical protein
MKLYGTYQKDKLHDVHYVGEDDGGDDVAVADDDGDDGCSVPDAQTPTVVAAECTAVRCRL